MTQEQLKSLFSKEQDKPKVMIPSKDELRLSKIESDIAYILSRLDDISQTMNTEK
jgi:hypothetical protein